MVKPITIGMKQIGPGHPCFIIAEAGVNHNGDMSIACKLIDVAAKAGADAIKFQTFKAERIVTPDAPKANYQRQTTESGESQYEMLKRLELSEEVHRQLQEYTVQQGLLFLSTPFDEQSADFLESLQIPAYKVPSGEITNTPFLSHLARKAKPLIMSTGMATLSEVEEAVRTVRESGNRSFVLLHCVSDYPADPSTVNLRAMNTMLQTFDVPIGYSDHTVGVEVALAAVALGACIVEKHFTLSRSLPGPDHKASLEPRELNSMIRGIRIVEAALGHGRKEPSPSEANTAAVARKSLVAAQDIPAGTILNESMIAIMRPGTGLPPAMRPYLVGRVTRIHIPAGTLLNWEMVL